MSEPKTKVLSTRIPINVMKELEELCADRGISRSDWLCEKIGVDRVPAIAERPNPPEDIPEDVSHFLRGTGATIAGIASYNFVYKAMASSMQDNGLQRFTPEESQVAAIASSVIIGLVAYGAFDSIIKPESE